MSSVTLSPPSHPLSVLNNHAFLSVSCTITVSQSNLAIAITMVTGLLETHGGESGSSLLRDEDRANYYQV